MKTRVLKKIGLLSVAIVGSLGATSEIRSPLSFYYGTMHYPLDPVDEKEECKWVVDTWKTVYGRTADETFKKDLKCGDICDDRANGVTTDTAPLSALFFGKSDFLGEEAFAGGILVNTPAPPALSFAKLSPRFDYNEYGVFVGAHVYRDFGDDLQWRVGARASIPFKVIEVEQSRGCDIQDSLEEALENVRVCKEEDHGQESLETTCAYRLDFLSTLQLRNGAPMVVYGDGAANGTTGITTIAGIRVSGSDPDALNQIPQGSVTMNVLGRPDETPPPADGSVEFAQESNNPIPSQLPAGGVPLAENSRAFFYDGGNNGFGNNYAANLANDRDAQRKLFIVPREDGDGLVDDSVLIQNIIEDALDEGLNNDTATKFFRDCCIFFCQSERTVGMGDLDTEVYFGYHPEDYFADIKVGFRFPTGKKNDDPRQLLFQPTGNNGHVEARFALEAGWRAYDWLGITIDGAYSRVIGAYEKRAAAFKGATVRNIGPNVDADVSWGYFTGHIDATFFHPRNKDLGSHFGYEFYSKQEDNIKYCKKEALDCLGNLNEIDQCLAESGTKAQTHKIRGECFYRIGFGEIFVGGSHIFAGKNAMKESSWHVGMNIYF